jgi:hypothetical protein
MRQMRLVSHGPLKPIAVEQQATRRPAPSHKPTTVPEKRGTVPADLITVPTPKKETPAQNPKKK